ALHRPELMRLLQDTEPGDAILIEQVDRLSRLDDNGWESLKKMINEKSLSIISLDLPTSHIALSTPSAYDFTHSMLRAVNNMMLDMLAAIARKDYEDRRRRQMEGITAAKEKGKYRGRLADKEKHELIRTLRKKNGKSINETARLAGVSRMTVIRACKDTD
ncbi:recombinase family protein, partial [Salmonella enterica]|nr:serine recombinase [Salmonella enterica subsp. enterica serovar Schwarzengrund]EIB1583402.1 recombinase family protein [Salmonella enterica]EKL0769310.1 recombinase family protein [Salmonella enterica subsp. enterica serovar Schwarzengrund]